MPLSANSLFHFTSGIEQLHGILSDNFHLSYCRENYHVGGHAVSFYVPMVSFCDIPLSQIKEHISKYGTYGIGMTREWAIRKGLNPVLYLEQDSLLSKSFQSAMRFYFTKTAKDAEQEDLDENYVRAFYALSDLSGYVKNYENALSRGITTIPNYRYSDEREWRYVPPSGPDQGWIQVASSKAEIEPHMLEKVGALPLEFEPNDIKYIILRDDSEISDFLAFLRRAKRRYAHEEVERLATRILTTQQIHEDI